MGLKNWLKHAFLRTGLEVRYADKHDAWVMKQRLLQGIDVRTVIDGGAYVGEWAHRYRDAFAQATVHAFEPFPTSFATLKSSLAGKDRIALVPAALGAEPGQRTLFVNQLAATSSLLPIDPDIASAIPDPNWVKPVEQVKTPVTTLDRYCGEQSIERVNLLKLDIQGSELAALQGGEELLKAGRVDVIYSEMLFSPHYIGQAYHFQICEYLHRFGYHLYGVYNLFVHDSGKMVQADGIFVSPPVWKSVS